MGLSRQTLNYSEDLAAARNHFFLLADGFTIRCSLAEASSRRYIVELPLRRYKRRVGLFVRPLDSEVSSWIVESSVVHPELARMELLLTNTPADVALRLLQL